MEIIAVAEDKSQIVSILDLESGNPVTTLTGHTDFVACISFSSCGTLLASGSIRGEVIIWDCQSWTRIQSLSCPPAWICSQCFSSSGDRILLVSNKVLRLWNIANNAEEMRIDTAIDTEYPIIRCVCLSSCSNLVAVANSFDIWIYNADIAGEKRNFVGNSNAILSMNFNNDGGILASVSDNGTVILWDVASGNVLRQLGTHSSMITQLLFNIDSSRLMSSSLDNIICIWDVSTCERMFNLPVIDRWLRCCCFSKDGSKVIIGRNNELITCDSVTGAKLMSSYRNANVISVSSQPYAVGSYI